MSKKTSLFFLTFVVSSLTVQSQTYEKYLIHEAKVPGPQKITNVRETVQDNFGFLWVGTQDGLFRYGSEVLGFYTTDLGTKHSLITPDIRSMVVDSVNNKVWIAGISGGINIVNLTTGVIEYKNILYNNGEIILITRICIAEKKVFVASSSGIYSIDKKNYEVNKLPGSDSLNVLNLLIIKDKLLAFTQSSGIILYDIKKSKILSRLPVKAYSNTIDLAYFEAKASEDCFYVATSDGVKGFKLNSQNIIYEKDLLDFLPLKHNNHAFGLCIDKEKNIWYSNESNLIKVNFKTKKYSVIKNASTSESPVWLNSIYTIFCDNEDNLWLGCQQGLAYLKNSPPYAENISSKETSISNTSITQAYYLYPQSDSIVYACSENGLYKVNCFTGDIYPIDSRVSYDYFYCDNILDTLVSNTKGLFSIRNKKFIPFESIHKEFGFIGIIRINSIVKMGDIYIFGTENHKGIIVWDYRTKIVKHFDGTNNKSFNEPIINTVFQVSNNEVAVLGDTHFNVFNIQTYKFTTHTFKKNAKSNYSIFFDISKIKNKYYVATYGSGVIVLDSNFTFEKEFSTNNGLRNNGVYKLLPWRDSLLFITTNQGLSCLNVNKETFKTFYANDGLHDNVFEETSGNTLNDKIYAGGKGGFTIFNPLNLPAEVKIPAIYFYGINIELSDEKKTDTVNLKSKSFYIPFNVLQATIKFIGINYFNPERTIYQYRIIEKSKNWIDLKTQNFITLIGLSPGTYHLQVKAANEDGIWSEPKELILIFEPKWYQTWWFYLSIALTVAGILYSLYSYRIKQIQKQHAIRKNIATDLHDDLGSTLNSVKVFTNLAISGVKQEENLQQVKDNLTEATMSLRDMIWVLDDSLDTVDELITRLKQFAIPVAGASNIVAVIKADSEVNSRQLTKEEKRNLFLICKEAINNSIKYSSAGQIDVSITASGKKIKIVVADNGKGFNVEEVKKGYGLKNMQYRAGQIKYKVSLVSFRGEGTQVEIKPA
ncbi:sensor histidine kinase [Ferruginibacter profundus]